MLKGAACAVLALVFLAFYCVHRIFNINPFLLRAMYAIIRERQPQGFLANVKKNITLRIIGAYAYCRGWGMR